jgi:hypothetical protein
MHGNCIEADGWHGSDWLAINRRCTQIWINKTSRPDSTSCNTPRMHANSQSYSLSWLGCSTTLDIDILVSGFLIIAPNRRVRRFTKVNSKNYWPPLVRNIEKKGFAIQESLYLVLLLKFCSFSFCHWFAMCYFVCETLSIFGFIW